jgi:hypothetical protein
VAQQRLPKGAVAQEVHVLFHVDGVLRQHLQDVLDFARIVGRHHAAKVHLAQVAQPLGLDALGELVEIDRLVDVFEMLVIQVGVRAAAKRLQLRLEQEGIGTVLARHRLAQEVKQVARLLDADLRLMKMPRVIKQHVADHPAHMPAGIRVVADICDALRRQMLFADL